MSPAQIDLTLNSYSFFVLEMRRIYEQMRIYYLYGKFEELPKLQTQFNEADNRRQYEGRKLKKELRIDS